MKRFVSILLSLLMLLSSFSFSLAEGDTAAAAGDEAHGFVVKDVRRFEMVGADIVLYEHEKTGAQVMFILNDDLNRTFEITFRTPCLTDKGIAHVLEHSVLDGSRKYPSKSLFFNLSYQTYNTYMNAATYNFMTTYPVASLSEDQLLLYADFYTDSVFNPMIIEDESIFKEEAWRYELAETAEGETLGIAGTVYSEMLGAYTISRAANLNYENELFPGATDGRDSGGIPEVIYTMTWEDVKEFHAAYYHPSNSLTCIYGKIENVDGFLELLDGYFSAYEKKEFDIKEETYEPISAPVEAKYEYGLASGSDTNNGSIVYYGFVCESCDEEDALKLDFLTTLINDSSSVFQQRMQDELPSASAACYIDNTTPEISVYMYATGLNAEDAPKFRQIVNESIESIVANGFEADAVDAIVSATVLDILLANESDSIGVDLIPNIAYYWASIDDMYFYFDYIDKLDLFREYAENGSLQDVAGKYLVNNQRTALVVTEPVAGLKDTQDAEFAAMLQDVKAAMSEEELAAIRSFDEEAEAPDTTNYISQLTAVTVDSLPEEKRIFDISDTVDENGIRHVNVDANTDGIGQVALLLDASGLTQEQLHYFKLFVDLVGKVDTASHTRQQLASLSTRYMYDGVIRVSVMEEGEGYHPYMRCTFTALDEDLQAGYDLIYELLFETNLDDAQAILNTVSSLKNELKRTITSNCYAVMLYRAEGADDPTTAYFGYMTYLDYYNFLSDVEARLQENPEEVLNGLKSVQKYFFNRNGAVAGFVGNSESAALNDAIAAAFLSKLDDNQIEAQSYDFGATYNSEALIVDGSVLYNMYYASWEDLGLDGFDGALDAVTAYVNDVYLYPLLRDQYGAYGVMHYATDAGIYMISYRDPNLLETFEVYDSIPELIEADEPDQETLNGYILSSYSTYAKSNGELADGFSALLNHLSEKPQEDTIKYMHQLKGVNVDTFKSYAGLYRALTENAKAATSGSAGTIKANAELFENILNPFGVKAADEVVFEDISEDGLYNEAIYACYENGFVYPLSDTQFGIYEPATLGDLAVAMYVLIGGDNSPEDAIAYLSGYGIIPAEAADTELTREQLALYTAYFCEAVGIPVEEMSVEEYLDADELIEGDNGYVGFILANGGILIEDGKILPQTRADRFDLCYMWYYLFIAE
ncbi:MAG: insulinase family protein [Clostridia bacterium]|nr:insulinase family protein [Clostridia bacterium]